VARVLIIDDSSFMRKRIGSVIKEAGHEIAGTARDGAEGCELYYSLKPDLVIMDVTMRGMDGIKAAEMIRKSDPDARIVFMSLVTDPGVISKADALGAIAFLGKNDSDRLCTIMSSLET